MCLSSQLVVALSARFLAGLVMLTESASLALIRMQLMGLRLSPLHLLTQQLTIGLEGAPKGCERMRLDFCVSLLLV